MDCSFSFILYSPHFLLNVCVINKGRLFFIRNYQCSFLYSFFVRTIKPYIYKEPYTVESVGHPFSHSRHVVARRKLLQRVESHLQIRKMRAKGHLAWQSGQEDISGVLGPRFPTLRLYMRSITLIAFTSF